MPKDWIVSEPPIRPPIGQLLVDRGLLSAEELAVALQHQERTGQPLGEILRELRVVSAPALADMLALQQAWRPLGQLLVEKGLLTEPELAEVLEEQKRTGARLGDIIRRRALVSAVMLEEVLAEQDALEVELEQGFGAGLRGAIDRRHQISRGRQAGSPDVPDGETRAPLQARLDAVPSRGDADRLTALQEALEDRERTLTALGAANQRMTEQLARARAELEERDAMLSALQRQLRDLQERSGAEPREPLHRASRP